MTIAENIAFGLKIKKKSKQYIDDKIKYALKLVNLDGYENRMADSLSGGQQQRIAIARAIASNVDLIFADEPTGNLDTETEQEIIKLFQMLSEKYGKTIIAVTHSNEVSKLSDHRVLLKNGVLQDL